MLAFLGEIYVTVKQQQVMFNFSFIKQYSRYYNYLPKSPHAIPHSYNTHYNHENQT